MMVERRRLFAEQQRRIEAHQRAARAKPAPSRRASLPPGTVQIPIDMRRPNPLAKPKTAAVAAPSPSRDRAAATAARARLAAVAPQPPPCPNQLPYPGPLPPMKTASILQIFPEIRWHICVTDMGPKGLWVGPVELLRDPSDGWRPILYQAGLAELFVPYHNNPAARYYDMGGPSTRALSPILPQDTTPNGAPLWLSNESQPTVAVEIRDRGIAWLCKGDTQTRRRARELVIWGVSDAGNYDNIIEFTFRDDGAISFRTGNTGYNSPTNLASMVEPHSHDSLWYVDMDLNGYPNDSASMLEHYEPYTTGTGDPRLALDQPDPIAVEGSRWFKPYVQIHTLLVEDIATQFLGFQHWGYEFVPTQNVPLRHFGWQEHWTDDDIYVTRYRYADTLWASPIANHQVPDLYLFPALNFESTVNEDLVLWIKTAAHHGPTTEDLAAATLFGGRGGVTLTHWSGFRIEPHNLFPMNPLGEPEACGT